MELQKIGQIEPLTNIRAIRLNEDVQRYGKTQGETTNELEALKHTMKPFDFAYIAGDDLDGKSVIMAINVLPLGRLVAFKKVIEPDDKPQINEIFNGHV